MKNEVKFNYKNSEIIFRNTFFGKETIFVNKKKVSEKFALHKSRHNFVIEGDSFKIEVSVSSSSKINLLLFKNGKFIEENEFIFDKRDVLVYTFITIISSVVFLLVWYKIFTVNLLN